MRVIYMGTPDFAVPALEAIVEAGHEVVMVVTQPDKPKGRGGKVLYTPVKEKALSYGIEVFQPVKIREQGNVSILKSMNPDIIVVAAFGQILSKDILLLPRYGCINIHASILPRWRGAAPIQSSILEGDLESGITIMQMDEGLDTGDMLMQSLVQITPDETGGSLHDKLAGLGGELVVKCMAAIEDGSVTRTPQPDGFTYAKKLEKKMGLIDFNDSAKHIECLVRGLNPWPSAYTYYKGKLLKIWRAAVADEEVEYECEPGTIVDIRDGRIYVSTGKGCLIIDELQPEGKRRMAASDYLRGCNMTRDELLG